jgi:hypothetical protein
MVRVRGPSICPARVDTGQDMAMSCYPQPSRNLGGASLPATGVAINRAAGPNANHAPTRIFSNLLTLNFLPIYHPQIIAESYTIRESRI